MKKSSRQRLPEISAKNIIFPRIVLKPNPPLSPLSLSLSNGAKIQNPNGVRRDDVSPPHPPQTQTPINPHRHPPFSPYTWHPFLRRRNPKPKHPSSRAGPTPDLRILRRWAPRVGLRSDLRDLDLERGLLIRERRWD